MIKFLKNKSNRSYTYGSINSIEDSLEKKYNTKPIFIRGKVLDLAKFTMAELDKNKKHCSLTAITRILLYYNSTGYKNIPDNKDDIYRVVRENGIKRLGYLPAIGTIPFRVSSILRGTLKRFNYKTKVRGNYIWSFYDLVKEIDKNRPLVFNILRGYYRKHTVTLVGYKVYIVKGKVEYILIINDGWNYDLRFINFNEFSENLLFAGIGSFNTIKII